MPVNRWPDTFSKHVEVAAKGLALHYEQFAYETSDRMVDATKRHTPVDEGRLTAQELGKLDHPTTSLSVLQGLGHEPGALRDSIERVQPHQLERGVRTQVWRAGAKSDLSWASFVEDDTLPHRIDPHGSGRLLFFNEETGKWTSPKAVNHPGTQGQHMFLRGAVEAEAGLTERGEKLMSEWAKEFGF